MDAHLCVEILTRLPIKTIIRFRCISKSWNSLITSSFFINHHLSLTNSSPNDSNKKSFIFGRALKSDTKTSFTFYNPQDFPSMEHLSFRRFPFHYQHLDVIGVVHGVVCLSREGSRRMCREGYFSGSPSTTSPTILWNPVIHKYIEIPPPPSFEGSDGLNSCGIGFGFDSRTNQFKIARMTNLALRHKSLTFEVYSTREGGGWRSVATDFGPCMLLVSAYGCFKDGSIHWMVKSQNLYWLLVFSCESEELKTMEIPKKFNKQDNFGIIKPLFFAIRGGMLSVMASKMIEEEEEEEEDLCRVPKAEVWVMEEYGVPKSWKKLKQKLREFVKFEEKTVYQFVEVVGCCQSWERIKVLKRSHQPLIDCYDLQPSMYLMDARKVSLGTMNHDDEDWKVAIR